MPIQYYLQPNPVTPNPNDQSARVATLTNLTLHDIAQELVNRGNGPSLAQVLSVLTASEQLIAEKIAEGHGVNTPLITIRPGISGVFTDPTDTFDPARHVLRANPQAGPLLEQKLLTATTHKIIRPEPAPLLVAFTNKNTGGVNSTLTPGGIGQITGEQLKFDPAIPAAGIYFVPTVGADIKVPTATIATRTEGELLFIIPALAAGSYRLEVRRQYGVPLRTGQLGQPLTV
jgi:hypothetical protein